MARIDSYRIHNESWCPSFRRLPKGHRALQLLFSPTTKSSGRLAIYLTPTWLVSPAPLEKHQQTQQATAFLERKIRVEPKYVKQIEERPCWWASSGQKTPELPACMKQNDQRVTQNTEDKLMDFSCLYLSVSPSVCLSASLSLSAFQIHLVYSHKYSLYYHAIINATATSGNQISYKSEIVGQAQTAAGFHWRIFPNENPSGACKLEPHPL